MRPHEILIGCPVSRREWILDRWFDHVEVACGKVGLEPGFVFVGDPERDGQTFDIVERRTEDGARRVIPDPAPSRQDIRVWNNKRYRRMVELRNKLLAGVRRESPPLFLSLDSDILRHPQAIVNLVESVETHPEWSAVGGKVYLSASGFRAPSWGRLSRQGKLQRSDHEGVFDMQILMAVKLMKPEAYGVDYEFSTHGEDTGWSLACANAGLKFGVDSRVISKHVMSRQMLEIVDPRVGY